MNIRPFAFMALSFGLAAPASAQADRSTGYGSRSYAIPGTSAVALQPSAAATPQPMTPSFAMAPMMPSARTKPASGAPTAAAATAAADTIYNGSEARLPASADHRGYPAPPSPYRSYGWLHPGLNVSLDLSVFAQFGKNARGGAGFTQSLTATYLQPLGKKAWMAVGGYVDHTIWNGDNYTTGGLYGEIGYQFNDHWAAYVYGRKSIVNNGVQAYGYPYMGRYYGMGYPYLYNNLGDKLGAAVRWTPTRNFSMELSVEKNWYPNTSFGYADNYKYNYPAPQKP